MTSGYLKRVDLDPSRGFLTSDHAAGATSLSINDGVPFSTGTEVVSIDEDLYDVMGLVMPEDEESSAVLTISPGLLSAMESNEPVDPVPQAGVTYAQVEVAGSENWERVLIPQEMQDSLSLVLGPHEPAEAVEFEDRGRGPELTWVEGRIQRDGSVIDPDTLPPAPPTPPVTPASSPEPKVTGFPQLFMVEQPGVENDSIVEYEYHVATTTSVAPSAATMSGPLTKATSVGLTTFGTDETPFVYGTDYYFAVVATSGGLHPAPSAWVGPYRLRANGPEDLLPAFLKGYHLSTVLLLTSLLRTAEVGARVELDNGGIRVYDSTGALRINLSASDVFLDADRALIRYLRTLNATLEGVTEIPAGSSLRLRTGIIAAPALAPSAVEAKPLELRALESDAKTAVTTDEAGTYWWQIRRTSNDHWNLVWTDPATGDVVGEVEALLGADSVQSLALTNAAVFIARTSTASGQTIVRRPRSGSGGTTLGTAAIATMPAAPGSGGYAAAEPIIGVQRTTGDVLVAHRVQGAQTIGVQSYADQEVMVRRYTPSAAGTTLNLALSQTARFGISLYGTLASVLMDNTSGSFDMPAAAGSTAVVVSARAPGSFFGTNTSTRFVANSGTVVAASGGGGAPFDWYNDPAVTAPDTLGTMWDGTAFWGTDSGGDTVRKFGTAVDAANDRWRTYTFVSGSQETMMAPPLKARSLGRYKLRWTIPALPAGVTGIRLYESADATTRTRFERVETITGLTPGQQVVVTQDPTVPPAGAATNPPPAASNYAGGAVGSLTTNDADTAIYGDGRMTARDALLPNDVVNKRLLDAGSYSEQVALTSTANPTSTTNVTLAGLSITVTSPGTSAVYLVEIDATVSISVANTLNSIELLVDGVAVSPTMRTRGPVSLLVAGHKKWRVTGLTAGTHTFSARTRNSAASTDASVLLNETTMTVERKA